MSPSSMNCCAKLPYFRKASCASVKAIVTLLIGLCVATGSFYVHLKSIPRSEVAVTDMTFKAVILTPVV